MKTNRKKEQLSSHLYPYYSLKNGFNVYYFLFVHLIGSKKIKRYLKNISPQID